MIHVISLCDTILKMGIFKQFLRVYNLCDRHFVKKTYCAHSAARPVDLRHVAYLNACGITENDIVSNGFKITYDFETLRHYVEILEECHIGVTLENLKSFKTIFTSELIDLAKNSIFKETRNVEKSMLAYLEKFPYDVNLLMPEMDSIKKVYTPIKQYHRRDCWKLRFSDCHGDEWPPPRFPIETRNTIEIIQIRILRQYYSWRLNAPLKTIDKLIYNYSKITGVRSLRSLRRTLDVLENKFQLPKNKIVRNFFLMSINSSRLEDVINNVPQDFNLKKFAHVAPKILARSSQQIREINQVLKDHDMLHGTDYFKPFVFTFTPCTVRSRVEAIKKGPLSNFMGHHRIYELIFYFNKAQKRVEELKRAGCKCFGISVLVCNEQLYQRFLESGEDKVHTIADHLNYLVNVLDVSVAEIKPNFIRHPLRHFVALFEIKDTVEYLLDRGFSKHLIAESSSITLYPRERIEAALEDMEKKAQELEELGFENGFLKQPASKFTYRSSSKYPDKRLILCLYFMEKPFHFTGEGVVRSQTKTLRD